MGSCILVVVNGQAIDSEVKKFLEIDYHRSRATRHYANFLALRVAEISNNNGQYGYHEVDSGEFFRLNQTPFLIEHPVSSGMLNTEVLNIFCIVMGHIGGTAIRTPKTDIAGF